MTTAQIWVERGMGRVFASFPLEIKIIEVECLFSIHRSCSWVIRGGNVTYSILQGKKCRV